MGTSLSLTMEMGYSHHASTLYALGIVSSGTIYTEISVRTKRTSPLPSALHLGGDGCVTEENWLQP